jgi:hypothetical protein
MRSGVWFLSAEQRLELDRGSVVVMKGGELNRGRRCAAMWLFPQVFKCIY